MFDAENTCARLLALTGHYVDRGDVDNFVRLFDDDGELLAGGTTYRGHVAIRQFFGTRNPSRVVRHLITPPVIFIDGDEGRGLSCFTVYEAFGDPDSVHPLGLPVTVGEFYQTYRKGPDGWRIASHGSRKVFQKIEAAA